ncbi:type IV toxin-antitoxin system AbiEi family antitoxin domain-containing protein [Hoyosella subflava]|uniref:type IV toxin-antitoxin system AbiEi family antitoxin domain-containing protein n=1 Tax=Hoyosella subflava TaxID=639313 RepID=UPI000A2F896E|nr:type IV toxin-antitoxin system AbiEi family antitoxin domain-containing protein [Hoyosella subflava]
MAAQDGVITLHQAISAGMSQSAVSRRVASGEWRRLDRGVYLRSDHRLTGVCRYSTVTCTAQTSRCTAIFR